MKTYCSEEIIILEKYKSKAFDLYFKDRKLCVLDIETTGLSPVRSQFILGSLLSFENDGQALLKQYFAEEPSEEKKLLKTYLKEILQYDILLTYNGRRFDLPFLLSRANQLGMELQSLPYNLDLYLILNDHSSLRKFLPNLKQKTIENFMGLWQYRSDKISGAESVTLYYQYLHSKGTPEEADECRRLMLLHNRDDVLQLGKLLPILAKVDLHKAMYHLGFPVIAEERGLFAENIKFEKNLLIVRGTQTKSPADFISYGNVDSDCFIKFDKKQGSFEASFPLFKKSGLSIIDLLKLPVDTRDELSEFPNFENGYLALKNNDSIHYLEVNFYVKTFLHKILEKISEDNQ